MPPADARAIRVVITGASSGLGSALAKEIDRRFPGSTFMLIARREDRLRKLADDLAGAQCECSPLDVTDATALSAACRGFVDRHGAPDMVIASAGVSAGTLTGIAEDRAVFRRILAVNLLAVFDTFAPFIPSMRAARRGTLVGIGSVAGIRGLPGAEAYSASKSALMTYLESLRIGLRGSGIAVVCIVPGFIRTEMTAVNDYPMPFLMPADDFAQRAVDAILRKQSRRTIPWQMAWVARALSLLPRSLYDRLFANAPRKARQPSLGGDDEN